VTTNPLCILAGVSSRRRGIATSPQCGQAIQVRAYSWIPAKLEAQ